MLNVKYLLYPQRFHLIQSFYSRCFSIEESRLQSWYFVNVSLTFFKMFSFLTPEVTIIVSPQKFYKILRRRQIVPVGPRNWTKKVSCITYNTGRDQRVSLSVLFRHFETSSEKIFPKRSDFNFFWVLRQNGCWKISKGGSPLSVFLALWDFFSIFFYKSVPDSQMFSHFEVLLLLLSLRSGAELSRSRLVSFEST